MADPQDEELQTLLDEFVGVRLVQMHGVDLSRFQFDYAMTWAVFFMHADGSIYGRYGSRSALQKDSAREMSLVGFKHAVRGALDLHRRYLADPAKTRPAIAGKQSSRTPQWARPELIPRLAKNPFTAKPFGGPSERPGLRAHGVGCIHCHMVQGNDIMSRRGAGLGIPDHLVWPYPMPWAIGLRLDPDTRAQVQRVFEGTAAARAGLQPGDVIHKLDGQEILSTADVQWVLHHAPSRAKLSVEIRRGDAKLQKSVQLAEHWRRKLGDWRFVNLGICMQIAGFNGRPDGQGRQRLSIRVQRVHPRRMKGIDLRRNDRIVALKGKREAMNLGQLTRFLLDQKPGSKIRVTVRRPRQDGEHDVELQIAVR